MKATFFMRKQELECKQIEKNIFRHKSHSNHRAILWYGHECSFFYNINTYLVIWIQYYPIKHCLINTISLFNLNCCPNKPLDFCFDFLAWFQCFRDPILVQDFPKWSTRICNKVWSLLRNMSEHKSFDG